MTDSGSRKLMALNWNKAGLVGLDKERIDQIIEECSKGSKFYLKKKQDQMRIDGQVAELKSKLSSYSPQQLDRARREADKIINCLRVDRDLSRTIVHVDMDMFYAAVEIRDNPALRGVPMAVGGMGMLTTSNYEARKFGVRGGMPGFIAKKLCPNLVIVPGNMEKYAAVSEVVRGVFEEYDPNFAPLSLDEAYLDLTDLLSDLFSKEIQKTAWSLVEEMRQKIFERTRLTASAGIAPNCFLAKMCSDLNKPNGQHQVLPDPDEIMNFVSGLNLRKVGGIGNVQEQLLRGVGVTTCRDLYDKRGEIRLLFSELSSNFYLAVSQGIGSNKIEPPEERERKSISKETTFPDTSNRQKLLKILQDLCKNLASDCSKKGILGQSVTVKIKSHDFKTKTKVAQLSDYSNNEKVINATAKRIFFDMTESSGERNLTLRLMGVRLSNLKDKDNDFSKAKPRNILSLKQAFAEDPERKPYQEKWKNDRCSHIDLPMNSSRSTLLTDQSFNLESEGKANFFGVAWLHCNECKVESAASFFMTSCCKVLCHNCSFRFFSNCNICSGHCKIVELNENAPKDVLNLFCDMNEKFKKISKISNFQRTQQKMLLEHKCQRNERMHEEYLAIVEENKAIRHHLNQLKEAESEMDQKTAFLENEIERYIHHLTNDRNDLSQSI